ncbi:hypothetical protein BX600DRAFT_276959 [Xylariales sp. PMI_506]|nr:hypothetical protein BX600DRAFT_276959 [Xylariales sp. PMI_506]
MHGRRRDLGGPQALLLAISAPLTATFITSSDAISRTIYLIILSFWQNTFRSITFHRPKIHAIMAGTINWGTRSRARVSFVGAGQGKPCAACLLTGTLVSSDSRQCRCQHSCKDMQILPIHFVIETCPP